MLKDNMKLFNDILKVGKKYSQGRVYLMLSIVAYYLTLILLTIMGSVKTSDINLDSFKIIIDALQWAMALFAGYVFGSKGLEVIKILKGNKSENTDKSENINTK